MPQVTVVIPCINQGKFIQECIDSLHRQTLQDWTAIVLDDCSTDGVTPALCDAVAGPKVKVVHLPRNHGRALVRNVGVEMAETEAIANLDADDRLAPDFLATLVPMLLERETVGMAYADLQRFGARSDVIPSGPFDRRELYLRGGLSQFCVFRKSALIKAGGYRREFTTGGEDKDFCLSIVDAGYEIAHVAKPLYEYRCHSESWSSTQKPSRELVFDIRMRLYQIHREGFERSGAAREFLYDTYMKEASRLFHSGSQLRALPLCVRAITMSPTRKAARLLVRLLVPRAITRQRLRAFHCLVVRACCHSENTCARKL